MGQKEKDTSVRIGYSFLRILTGSDLSLRRLPLMKAESRASGPLIWLTACAHGDEVGGIVIVQEVFKRLRRFKLRKGAVYAFPLMNPIGFETTSRNITFTKEDLNRSFPGNKSGSLGERIAEIIFSTIGKTAPELVIDIHHDWIKSIPYTLVDNRPGIRHKQAYQKARQFSKQTGFPVISDIEDIHHTLSYSLIQADIPALTLELGEPYIVNESNIQYGVNSVWNILASLEMVEQKESFVYPLQKPYQGRILNYLDRPVCSSSGIIRFIVEPGSEVKKDQPIAKVFNAFGKLLETLKAESSGIVLGHTDSSVVFPGMKVMAFGTIPAPSSDGG